MDNDIFNPSIASLQMAIFMSFILTATFFVTIIVCGCCKKKPKSIVDSVDLLDIVEEEAPTDGSSLKVKSEEAPTDGSSLKVKSESPKHERQTETEKKSETKSKSSKSKDEKKKHRSKKEKPEAQKNTVGRRDYATFKNIDMKITPSIVAKPKPSEPKKTVDRKQYATMIGIENKLEPSIFVKKSKSLVFGVNYLNLEPNEKKKPGVKKKQDDKKKPSTNNYVEIGGQNDKGMEKGKDAKGTVDENQYGTLQIAYDKDLKASVIRKVSADQYGTMYKIDEKNALSPTIAAKPKPNPKSAKNANTATDNEDKPRKGKEPKATKRSKRK